MMAFGYTATHEKDGTLVVHDVPIFAECERGDMVFDGPWIAAAVSKAKLGEREGYLPPLHIRHHGEDDDNVQAAGMFRITGARPLTLKGARRIAVFADLIFTEPYAQSLVLEKRLPYRSVEIFNVEDPGINGLALLDHEAPYLELPMLVVEDVKDQRGNATIGTGWSLSTFTDQQPAVAYFRKGTTAKLLFRYEDSEMTKQQQDEQTRLAQQNFSDDKPDKKDGDGDGDKMKGGAMDVSSIVKAIESGEIAVKDLDAILVAIQTQKSGNDTPEEGRSATPAPAAAPGAESMRAQIDPEKAELEGRIAALEARLAEQAEQEQVSTDISAAMSRLADRPLGADLEQKLTAYRQEHGSAAFSAYVKGLEDYTIPAKQNGSTAEANFAAQPSNDFSKAVMAYAEKGPDEMEQAAQFSRVWRELKQRGHVSMDEERYIALNMKTPLKQD